MYRRFFYQLKQYLGFTNKESRGFVLLIPVLLILAMIPQVIQKINAKSRVAQSVEIQVLIDSLEQVGFEFVKSPMPIQASLDTAPSINQSSLKRIPFSEADSVTLQIVPGIGPSMASRIIRFRESLGGMHSKNQLLDVYGLKEEVAAGIWEYFDFESGISKKVLINEWEVSELAKHPYIGYGEAKVIVAYRNQHGKYTNPDDLLNVKIFTSEWINKISPYLDF